jgi:flagellar basal body-associated protein FliL
VASGTPVSDNGKGRPMLTIILIILVVLLLFGGFGYSRRGRGL